MKRITNLSIAFAFLIFGFINNANADIHIAIAVPLTGGEAVQGEEIRSGANLAVENVNTLGGVLGEKIILDYLDDACNATQATTVANKVVSNPPVAIIGHLCSAATLAAEPIYAEAGLPQITFSSNTSITEKGYKNVFRIIGRDDEQAPLLAKTITANLKPTDKIAIIDDKTSWGAGFADAAKDAFTNITNRELKIITVAMRDSIVLGQKDYSALITKLKQEKITNVVLGLLHVEAGLLVRQAREQGYDGAFFGGDPIQTPEFWKIAGSAAEGFQNSGPFDPHDTDKGKIVVANIKKANKSIGIYTFYGYAAVETIAQAIIKANTIKSDDLITALHKEVFDTLLGRVSFDDKGDLDKFKYQMFIWHDGEYSMIQNTTQQ
jgi:branched-chain amino acid transport system substrate-binding protein